MFRLHCPVVVTGAELPDPKDIAGNAISNLKLAAFGRADAFPGFYHAEGEVFESAHPRQTAYQRSHPIRARFWRPHYSPLGQPVAQTKRDTFDR